MTEKKYFAPSFPLISICEKKVERPHQFKNDRENAYFITPWRSFPTLRMANVSVIKIWEYSEVFCTGYRSGIEETFINRA